MLHSSSDLLIELSSWSRLSIGIANGVQLQSVRVGLYAAIGFSGAYINCMSNWQFDNNGFRFPAIVMALATGLLWVSHLIFQHNLEIAVVEARVNIGRLDWKDPNRYVVYIYNPFRFSGRRALCDVDLIKVILIYYHSQKEKIWSLKKK